MKILALSNVYPPDLQGGYDVACAQAVEAFIARGHEVRVLTSAPRPPAPPDPGVPYVKRSLRIIDVYNNYYNNHICNYIKNYNNFQSYFLIAENVGQLAKLVEEFRPDAAYVCNLVGIGGLGLMACLKHLCVPWVWQLGCCIPNLLCTGGISDRVVPALAQEFERQLEGYYVSCSSQLLEEIGNRFGGVRLNGPVELVPNWVAGKCPPPRTRCFRSGGHLRMVFAGQVTRWKGVDLIIEAADLLRSAGHENFSIDLYGKIFDLDFQALIHDLNLANHVRLKGLLTNSELMEIYDHYDVFLFPTWEREPFGMAPLEAAARGCVPVVTQKCGISEWLVHGVHCLKVERSAEALSATLGDVLDGRVQLEPLARRAAAVVWRDFHIDALAPRIVQLLEQAAHRPGGMPGTAEEAYRLALMADKLFQVMSNEYKYLN